MRAMWGERCGRTRWSRRGRRANVYLTRRYIWWDVAWFIWTVANTLTIVFIAQGRGVERRRVRRQRVHDVSCSSERSSGRTSASFSAS